MVAPTKEQFCLNKIKLVKDGGLDIVYTVRVTCGSENYYENYHFVSPRICHPDLLDKVESLKPMMLRVLHLSFFRSLMETPDFKATKNKMNWLNQLIKRWQIVYLFLGSHYLEKKTLEV